MDVRERTKLAEDERILSMTDGSHSEGRNPEALEADKARYKDSTYEIVSKVAYCSAKIAELFSFQGLTFLCRTPMMNLDTEERHKQDVFHAISRYPIIMLFISI